MKEAVVVDSTCLIGLELIGRLEILPNLCDPILAPPEVLREFGASAQWLRIETPPPTLVAALKLTVDDGEAEAIALAAERKMRIVLDDRRAREVAGRMNLKVIGTVGLLIRAKRAGHLTWVSPLLHELIEKGFYVSQDLKREALRLAGE